jgi:hypothetical protein
MTRAPSAFLLYCLITVALTYPLALELGSVFPHDSGDPALNTWILWWNARSVPLTPAWWNPPAFYPLAGVLSFSEHLLGLSLIATPIQWLGGSPLLAYNVVFLLTFPLCAIGAYLLTLEITKRRDAAFIGGLLFGFAPYRMAQLAHIQVLAAFAMPFALLGLHRYLSDARKRWLALFGAGWLLQALCNGYYMLFFSVLIAIWMLWFTPDSSRRRTLFALGTALCVAALPLVPVLWTYKRIHDNLGFGRDAGTMGQFAADASGMLTAEPLLALWGWLQAFPRAEGQTFPGLTITVLVVAAAWLLRHEHGPVGGTLRSNRMLRIARRGLVFLGAGAAVWGVVAWTHLLAIGQPVQPFTVAIAVGLLLLLTSARVRGAYSVRSVLGFYAVAAFVMWLFSMGPAPTLLGEPVMYRGPYALLMSLPGFSALRVPARFWMMSVLCLSVVGGVLFDRLGSRFTSVRRVLACVIAIGILSDAWIWTFPLTRVPDRWTANECDVPPGSAGAVMELPLGEVAPDVGAMYRSIGHGRPTMNGYSGYFPPHYLALRVGLASQDPDLLPRLAAHGLEYVVIDRRHRSERGFRRYVTDHDGVELVCAGRALAVYRLRQKTEDERLLSQTPLPVASLVANVNNHLVAAMTDGNLTSRWSTGPQEPGMMLEIDLGVARDVNGLQLALGSSLRDFPRGLRIETSQDHDQWNEVWQGTSAGRTVIAALRDPGAAPLFYGFPSTTTRYLRLWLTEKDPTFYWSVAELTVMGR